MFGLLAACSTAQARTIYVASNGDDAAEGSATRPVATPARALQLAGENDTILLRGGTYAIAKSLWVTRAGLSIASAPHEKAVLIAPIAESSGVDAPVIIIAPRVTLSNLEIRGGSYYCVKVDVNDAKQPATGVTVRDCRLWGSGRDCVKTFNADKLLIEGCNIGPSGLRDPSNAEGIDSVGSHGVTVRGCYIHDTATCGMYFKGGATDGLVENCRIENTAHSAGLLLGQDTDPQWVRDGTPFEARRCVARNNVIINTGGPGMGTYAGEDITFQNNRLYNVARESGAGVWVGVNQQNVGSRQVRFYNNVISINSERPFVFLLNTSGAVAGANNVYYNPTGKSGFRIERQGQVVTHALAAWKKATHLDANSREARASEIKGTP